MVAEQFIKSIPLFAGLDDSHLKALAQVTRRRRYPKASIVIYQGDPGDTMLIIVSGRVKVTLLGEGGREIILTILRSGDFFGDMALLDREPRSATVVCTEDTEVLVMHRDDFFRQLELNPTLVLNILRTLVRRLRETNEKIGDLAHLDVTGRVAGVLHKLAREEGTPGPDGRIAFRRPSYQELANLAGTGREVAYRITKDLAGKGYLTIQGKQIILHDPEDHSASVWVAVR